MKHGLIQLQNAKIQNSDGYLQFTDLTLQNKKLNEFGSTNKFAKLKRKPIDEHDLLVYRFYENQAPYTNLGSLGDGYDLTATESTYQRGGISGPMYFDNGALAFCCGDVAQVSTIQSENININSSEISIMLMITPFREHATHGRFFGKYGEIELSSNNDSFYAGVVTTSGYVSTHVSKTIYPKLYIPFQYGITYGDGFLKIYCNGKLASSIASTSTIIDNGGYYHIGSMNDGGIYTRHCGFIMEEIRICNTVRNENWFRSFFE